MNGGDQLARGAKSATFLPPKVSQEKWDAAFKDFCTEDIVPDDTYAQVETKLKEPHGN